MTDQDPRPLKATGDTPTELVRALDALGRDRDAARLARVAESLSATLAATGAPAAGGLSALTGVKLALIGLALGLGTWALLGDSLGGDGAPRDADVAAPATPVAVDATPKPAPAEPLPSPSAREAPAPLEAPQPTRAPERSPAPVRHGRARATDAPSLAVPTSAARAPTSEPTTSASEATTAPPSEQPAPEPQPARADADAEAPTKPAATPSSPPSEVALLQEARKAAAKHPEAALRLLDQHAARFSSGLLVPEREVLAIEVLRELGRDAEAARRLKRFATRYPKSIHLRRLERSASTGEGE